MALIRTWKVFAIHIFLASRCLIPEIWFEGQKEKMKTPGAAGVKTSICRIQVYVDIAVQPGGFNGSLIF